MLRIGGGAKRLGGGAKRLGDVAEEQAGDERLDLIGAGGKVAWQREDDVKVLCVERLGATLHGRKRRAVLQAIGIAIAADDV
ncbi:hypothetical protein NKH41_19985 [Mesorhizobium sp. M1169]